MGPTARRSMVVGSSGSVAEGAAYAFAVVIHAPSGCSWRSLTARSGLQSEAGPRRLYASPPTFIPRGRSGRRV
ncbi:hypothetical protein ACFPRL_21045 [Pseudoclavibacter helvolus]